MSFVALTFVALAIGSWPHEPTKTASNPADAAADPTVIVATLVPTDTTHHM